MSLPKSLRVGIGFVSESESYGVAMRTAKACPSARRKAGVTGEECRFGLFLGIDCALKSPGLTQGDTVTIAKVVYALHSRSSAQPHWQTIRRRSPFCPDFLCLA